MFQGYHYVATTSTQDQRILGYLSYGDPSPSGTQPIEIKATAINPVATGSTVAAGVSLGGCSDFSGGGCRLAAVSESFTGVVSPALYTVSSNQQLTVGVLAAMRATTAESTLPLQHDPGAPAHLLASSALTVSAGTASLDNAAVFANGDKVDATLVTHGVQVPLLALTAR